MVNSSFFADGEAYGTAVVTSNDNPASTTPSAAPSSLYAGGGVVGAGTVVSNETGPGPQSNTPSSFFTDGAVVTSTTVVSSDTPGNNAASQAPSGFYPGGNIYDFLSQESAVVQLLQALAAQTTSNASSASSSASSAANSATNSATSAASSAAAVQSAAGTATPIVDGAAAVGTSAYWAHEDHVHPTDTSRASVTALALKADTTYVDTQDAAGKTYTDTQVSPKADKTYVDTQDAALSAAIALKAPLDSPTFTGTTAAPTASAGDNSTKMATTAFVSTAVAAGGFPSGTTMLFYQAAAPTGWTKLTTQNDKALRVVSGSGGVAGGTNAFSTVMAQTVVGNTALTIAQMPAHAHTIGANTTLDGSGGGVPNAGSGQTGTIGTSSVGSGASHNHTIIMAIQYIDLILASKN
jgi:hypothetical protein